MGEVIWGVQRSAWPKNWRRDAFALLRSLCLLRWAPVATAREMFLGFGLGARPTRVLRYVTDTQPQANATADNAPPACPAVCLLHETGVPHEHFVVGVDHGLLGKLQNLAGREDATGEWRFDFQSQFQAQLRERQELVQSQYPPGRPGKAKALERAHQSALNAHQARYRSLVSVPLAVLILGDRAGIPVGQRRLLRVLYRELTRAKKSRQHLRPDRAHVYGSGFVAGRKPRGIKRCPLLDQLEEYVGFNGNGEVWGRGYKIATRMQRAGYLLPVAGAPARLKKMRQFLTDLATLAQRLGLIVGGLNGDGWHDLPALQTLPLGALDELSLRVYAPADYVLRWRAMLAASLGTPASETTASSRRAEQLLKGRLEQAGISQGDLARHLGKPRQFISALLNGNKSWPEGLLAKAEEFIVTCITSSSDPGK